MSNIIEVQNLEFWYTLENPILKGINFTVPEGTFLAVAGPNGAGKTTLLNLLCKILIPKSGTIKIDRNPINSYSNENLARKVAIVRQEFVPVFGFSVIETVMMARTPYYGSIGFETDNDKKIVEEAMKATNTIRFAARALGSLSAGERQRVFIARALAQNTPILLLDEPTNFLDMKHQVAIYDLLKAAQLKKGKTIISVTHDINLATQYCDEILLLTSKCSFLHGNPKDIFTSECIKKVFDVDVCQGTIGQESFFIPIGKYVKNTPISTKTTEDENTNHHKHL
jgi:iron complex transport system ATP-binding protein